MLSSESETSDSQSNYDSHDSDEEIYAAIKAGLIKPGTTIKADKFEKLTGKNRKKEKINNIVAIQNFIKSVKEDLGEEIIKDFKEIPCLTIPKDESRIDNAEEHAQKVRSNLANDDFKREALFALEAKASILKGLELLNANDIPTKRPEDYYAEMAKSDRQMEKVKNKIIKKGEEQERREKLRALRDQRKKGKEIQMEIKKKRTEEKKDFLKKVKLARKTKTGGDALFDDDSGRAGAKSHINRKRQYKDSKFGSKKGQKAGQKSGANQNTSFKSHSKNFSSSSRERGGRRGPTGGRVQKASNSSGGFRSKNASKKRPGKTARAKK